MREEPLFHPVVVYRAQGGPLTVSSFGKTAWQSALYLPIQISCAAINP